MKRFTVSFLVACALIGSAGLASAATVTDLQAQVQALLAQIAQMRSQGQDQTQAGFGVAAAVPASTGSTGAPDSCKVWYDGCNTCTREYTGGPLSCTAVQCIWNAGSKCTAYFDTDSSGGVPPFCRYGTLAMRRGSSGEAVSAIQAFLQSEGVLSANATGYFGPATEAAVRTWQSQNGLVSGGSAYTTGWGAIGPRTWAALRTRCAPIVGGDRDAHGCVPSAGYSWCAEKNKCLRSWEESCTSSNDGTITASPQSGNPPLTVTFKAGVNPTNDQLIADAGYYKIDFGDGSQYTFPCTDPSGTCRQPSTQHTYVSQGTYVATLVHFGYFGPTGQNERRMGSVMITVGGGAVACPAIYKPVCGRPSGCANTCPPGAFCTMMCRLNDPKTYSNRCALDAAGAEYLYDGTCTDASANKAPTISGISGPTTLTINQSGTWSVTASDPENQSLSYQVTWGDEYAYPAMMDAAVSSPVNYQTSTLTHTYTREGTFTISVTVTDAQGKSAQTSITVTVGSSPACTMEYVPVCGQKTVCPACRNSNPPCMAPCYLSQQTYGNTCQMNADGATLSHTGQCTSSY
jgi:peptidoglycan hydrolase-like protein with peptidoglycan-binding domain